MKDRWFKYIRPGVVSAVLVPLFLFFSFTTVLCSFHHGEGARSAGLAHTHAKAVSHSGTTDETPSGGEDNGLCKLAGQPLAALHSLFVQAGSFLNAPEKVTRLYILPDFSDPSFSIRFRGPPATFTV